MRLETQHLHSRQIFRSPGLAEGRRWKSPSTGKELVIVGQSGDADDPGRESALYAHEYYHYGIGPNLKAYPELGSAFEPLPPDAREHQKFLLARRVSEDGWCRLENDLICVPYHGRYGIYRVDLVGYGPTHWMPEMIDTSTHPNETWRALAIWRDPDRMVSIASLQRGWVIRSEQFARAKPRYAFKPDGELFLYEDRPDDSLDEPRGRALHVVEEIDPREDIEWDSGAEDYSNLRVRVRRLTDEGTYDPQGQVIEFEQRRHHRNATKNSPFQPVELVGQMAFDGSGVTFTLPKPLTF